MLEGAVLAPRPCCPSVGEGMELWTYQLLSGGKRGWGWYTLCKRVATEMGDKEKAAGGPRLSCQKEIAGRRAKLCGGTGLGLSSHFLTGERLRSKTCPFPTSSA